MARMTTAQKASVNNMNAAAQRVALGTRLDTLEYGSVATPSAGTISAVAVVKYSTTPAIGTATYVHAAIAMTSGTQTITTSITNPDYPRIVTIKGNASGITGNVVITGTNFAGATITDTIALNGSTEVLGVKAFKTVTSIALPAETHAGTDTVSVGVGNKLGFPIALTNANLCLAKNFDGAVDAGTVTAASTVEGSFYAPAGTLNGAKDLSLYFLSV